jgi:hypothetical protein
MASDTFLDDIAYAKQCNAPKFIHGHRTGTAFRVAYVGISLLKYSKSKSVNIPLPAFDQSLGYGGTQITSKPRQLNDDE